MKILLISAEAVPYCKVGGLGDVVGALYKELRKRNLIVYLALPFYRKYIKLKNLSISSTITVKMGLETHKFAIYRDKNTFLFDCPEFFDREGIYAEHGIAYEDNPKRFAFFSKAVLEFLRTSEIDIEIIHLNDWQTALIPFYLRTIYKQDRKLKKIATVLTIHNLGYQGIADKKLLTSLGIPQEYFTQETLEFYGKINILKGGIIYSDIITTVSPTYAKEITTKEFGYGLEGVLSLRQKDLYGILNGIDYETFSPERDPYIKPHYSLNNIRGKAICKRELIKETSINANRTPIVAYIGRLVEQKGFDILLPVIEKTLQWQIPFCVLGEGDHIIEEKLRALSSKYRNILFVKNAFDEAFSRRLYAGADIIIVPSKYEPCGLVQMIALRYGTIPVAKKTGGLSDTIVDYNPFMDQGYGFLFEQHSESALWECLKRALTMWLIKPRWRKLVQRAMTLDFSWQRSIEQYIEVYQKAIRKRKI